MRLLEGAQRMADHPAVRDAAAARLLSGLSGARVYLTTFDRDSWIVRKVASTPDTSARLRGQAARQMRFEEQAQGTLRTPRILDEGEVDGCYYFDMEFVAGVDGATYLRQARYDQVAGFAEILCRYVRVAANRPPHVHSNRTFFDALFEKTCAVESASTGLNTQVLSEIFLSLGRLRRLEPILPTLCHGDLTLENIIVDRHEQVWVVDLLDGPFEHYWMDLAKLHQDLAGEWYLRAQPPIAVFVLEGVSRRLLDVASDLDVRYPEAHALLLAITFARILPYARTPEETALITERLEHFAQQCRPPQGAGA